MSRSRTPAPGPLGCGGNSLAGKPKPAPAATTPAAATPSSGSAGGGGTPMSAAAGMVAKMVTGASKAPDLESQAIDLLNSVEVGKISFAAPADKDESFPHTIYVDGALYKRTAKRIGSYISILRADPGELPKDVTAITVPGGSIYRRQIKVAPDIFSGDLPGKETLVHELTHAALNYEPALYCRETVTEQPGDIYWALNEVIAYVAGASFLLLNNAQYKDPEPLTAKASEIAKKAQSKPNHLLEVADMRDLIARIRRDPTYRANIGDKNDYWDKLPSRSAPIPKTSDGG